MRAVDLLVPTSDGLYSPAGRFHVDPMRPVERALITHGHSDHARAGHGAVLATRPTLAIMALRYGAGFAGSTQEALPGRKLRVGDTAVTFHPAGHVLGSAQIAVECKATRIVVSGDYKRARDPTCDPFEPVACDVFITEATFGLPVFRHPDAADEIRRLLGSLRLFPERTHIVGAYALGKAQRIIALLREAGFDGVIHIHGALEKLSDFYQSEGIELGALRKIEPGSKARIAGGIAICPPSATQDLWSRRFADPVTAFASGWMRVRARARQKGVELPLVISDHADWDELTATITQTGAGEIWVTHGQEDALVYWSQSQGLRARPLRLVGYGDEGEAEPSA
jgi:putative mRNA 3-end processing factor